MTGEVAQEGGLSICQVHGMTRAHCGYVIHVLLFLNSIKNKNLKLNLVWHLSHASTHHPLVDTAEVECSHCLMGVSVTPGRAGCPHALTLVWDLGRVSRELPGPCPAPRPHPRPVLPATPSSPAAVPPGGSGKSPHSPGFQTGPISSSPSPFPSPAHSAGDTDRSQPLGMRPEGASLREEGRRPEDVPLERAPHGCEGRHGSLSTCL